MGDAILQVRWLRKRSRCREGVESSAWPLGLHSTSGHSCLGGGGGAQSGVQERSGLKLEMEQSQALRSMWSQRVGEPVQCEWGEWEEKGTLMFMFCVLTFCESSWLCSGSLPDASVQPLGRPRRADQRAPAAGQTKMVPAPVHKALAILEGSWPP